MTLEEEITKLKEERAREYHKLLKYHSLMMRAKKVYDYYKKLDSDHMTSWKSADRKLAMLDGRLIVVEPRSSSKRKEPEPDLTMEQIERLCEKFGIKLPETEEET